jgi:hypothetical protein
MTEQEESTEKPNNEGDLVLGTKATIAFLSDDGEVKRTEKVARSTTEILKYLQGLKEEEREDKISVKIKAAVPDESGKPVSAEFDMAEGTYDHVLEEISKRVFDPEAATLRVYGDISKLMDFSDLKGVVVTMVYEDATPMGFAMLSESTPVSTHDIAMLGAAAANQVKDFKYAMANGDMKIQFPDEEPQDASGIVGPDGEPVPSSTPEKTCDT